MALPICMKRMTRERVILEKHNPDYFVHFKDDNLTTFDVYIYGAPDSLYSHKLLKFRFEIPSNYPFNPPTVKFIQHGRGRYHPNLYAEGKVCLSILGTWPGEKWAQAMTCETVLVTIRSLLDNKPFLHEPNGKDDPNYNAWVEYAGWQLHLLDRFDKETEPIFQAFLYHTLRKSGSAMLAVLDTQAAKTPNAKQISNRYDRTSVTVNYSLLKERLSVLIMKSDGELTRLSRDPTHGLDVAIAIARLEPAPAPAESNISGLTAKNAVRPAPAPKLTPTIPIFRQPLNGQTQRHVSPAERQAGPGAVDGPDERLDKKQKQTTREVIDLT